MILRRLAHLQKMIPVLHSGSLLIFMVFSYEPVNFYPIERRFTTDFTTNRSKPLETKLKAVDISNSI